MRLSNSVLFSCFHKRASLALAPSLFSWASPASTAQLHVYARRPHAEHTKVFVANDADVSDLKDAVAAKLKLDVSPDRLRLLREVEGGLPVPLDSRRGLMEQSIQEGSSVCVEEVLTLPAAPQCILPAVLQFFSEDVGGTRMMVANLAPASSPVPLPFFMSTKEHTDLHRFLAARPSATHTRITMTPRMLLLTGTTKSGKTCLLHTVIPRLLAAEYAKAAGSPLPPRRRPVVFAYTFPTFTPAEECAKDLVDALLEFARRQSLPLPAPLGSCHLSLLPRLVADLARLMHARGEEVWLLLDELGAPIVASSPAGASAFTLKLKDMVEKCWAEGGTVVGSGSGMVALLAAMRTAAPNGFMLWQAAQQVQLGRQPPTPAAALAMARRLHAFHSASWLEPGAVAAFSPERLVAELERSRHSEATSPRPALVAHLLEALGAADWDSQEGMWRRALSRLLAKLRQESLQDAAVALERLPAEALRYLRALADGRPFDYTVARGDEGGLKSVALDVAMVLCEEMAEGEGATPVLLPPYGALLRSWILDSGLLAISSEGGSQGLHVLTRSNLKALHTLESRLSASQRSAVSEAVLSVLLRNGIGTLERVGTPGCPKHALRAPLTVEEFVSIPAIACVLTALTQEASMKVGGKSFSMGKLNDLLKLPHNATAREEYMQHAGFWLLLLLRHMEAHVAYPNGEVVRGGFSCAVIVEAVNAALQPLLEQGGSVFKLKKGVLTAGPVAAAGEPSSAPSAGKGKARLKRGA